MKSMGVDYEFSEKKFVAVIFLNIFSEHKLSKASAHFTKWVMQPAPYFKTCPQKPTAMSPILREQSGYFLLTLTVAPNDRHAPAPPANDNPTSHNAAVLPVLSFFHPPCRVLRYCMFSTKRSVPLHNCFIVKPSLNIFVFLVRCENYTLLKWDKHNLKWTAYGILHCHYVINYTKMQKQHEKELHLIKSVVESLFAAITSSIFCIMSSVSHIVVEEFTFVSICWCTAPLKSRHSISVRLRSGLWLDHCNTLILFFFILL